jgi:hypothetical protein
MKILSFVSLAGFVMAFGRQWVSFGHLAPMEEMINCYIIVTWKHNKPRRCREVECNVKLM